MKVPFEKAEVRFGCFYSRFTVLVSPLLGPQGRGASKRQKLARKFIADAIREKIEREKEKP